MLTGTDSPDTPATHFATRSSTHSSTLPGPFEIFYANFYAFFYAFFYASQHSMWYREPLRPQTRLASPLNAFLGLSGDATRGAWLGHQAKPRAAWGARFPLLTLSTLPGNFAGAAWAEALVIRM